jgi:chromosome segregation ATPase
MTHQRVLVYVFSLCFLFFLLPGCENSGPAEKAGEKIDETVQKQEEQFEEAKNEIAKAKAEIENLKNDLARARQERDEAKVRLEEAEQERQRILKEMEQSNISETPEKTTLEQQQNGSGSQGQEEMRPQSTNRQNDQ